MIKIRRTWCVLCHIVVTGVADVCWMFVWMIWWYHIWWYHIWWWCIDVCTIYFLPVFQLQVGLIHQYRSARVVWSIQHDSISQNRVFPFVSHRIYRLIPDSRVVELVKNATAGGKPADWDGNGAHDGVLNLIEERLLPTRGNSLDMTSHKEKFHTYVEKILRPNTGFLEAETAIQQQAHNSHCTATDNNNNHNHM